MTLAHPARLKRPEPGRSQSRKSGLLFRLLGAPVRHVLVHGYPSRAATCLPQHQPMYERNVVELLLVDEHQVGPDLGTPTPTVDAGVSPRGACAVCLCTSARFFLDRRIAPIPLSGSSCEFANPGTRQCLYLHLRDASFDSIRVLISPSVEGAGPAAISRSNYTVYFEQMEMIYLGFGPSDPGPLSPSHLSSSSLGY